MVKKQLAQRSRPSPAKTLRERLGAVAPGVGNPLSSALLHQFPGRGKLIKLAQAVKSTASDSIPQIVFYDEGIGTV